MDTQLDKRIQSMLNVLKFMTISQLNKMISLFVENTF